jgi:transcriptional regulator with XRE-family HTH domain
LQGSCNFQFQPQAKRKHDHKPNVSTASKIKYRQELKQEAFALESQDIFNKIDRLRQDKGWTTHYLSKQAGISHNTLYKWRNRLTMPSTEVLEALCDALQISLAQLFCGDEYADELPEENKKLLEYWSTLSRRQKQVIWDMIISLRGSK